MAKLKIAAQVCELLLLLAGIALLCGAADLRDGGSPVGKLDAPSDGDDISAWGVGA